ncbi:glutaredoxin family protein [Piscibacillus halophilus]|uniref:glutaredoxin family protein n=1 Tax=Piscibacillus halophilus TaxID=571933 RepID=UPI00158BDE31|nr:glutaredoxin domain-containing protein [Piscibacillus halophilus]
MTKQSVTIYSHDQSQKSQRLKEQLDVWGVNYKEKNITDNPNYLLELQKQGVFATPVIFIDDTCIEGLQLDRIKHELQI